MEGGAFLSTESLDGIQIQGAWNVICSGAAGEGTAVLSRRSPLSHSPSKWAVL